MTKAELIEALADFDNSAIVRFSYDNGDYWHHMIAHEVKFVDLLSVENNDYVEDYVINENEEGEFVEDEDYAIVLS